MTQIIERSLVAETARNSRGRRIVKESQAPESMNFIQFFTMNLINQEVDDAQVLIFEVETRRVGDRLIEHMKILEDEGIKSVESYKGSPEDGHWSSQIEVFELPPPGIFCEISSLIISGVPDEGRRVTFYKLGKSKLEEYRAMV